MSKRILILAGSPRKNGNSAGTVPRLCARRGGKWSSGGNNFSARQENRLLPGLLPLQKKRRHLYHQG